MESVLDQAFILFIQKKYSWKMGFSTCEKTGLKGESQELIKRNWLVSRALKLIQIGFETHPPREAVLLKTKGIAICSLYIPQVDNYNLYTYYYA
jgi:hypothetical protein